MIRPKSPCGRYRKSCMTPSGIHLGNSGNGVYQGHAGCSFSINHMTHFPFRREEEGGEQACVQSLSRQAVLDAPCAVSMNTHPKDSEEEEE